ncbi:MAG TPA: ABC transporter ATP-binding protein [Candidatus Binatia bacterium]|nr:ABC transporter ATP-binding protein [Candidatus Binatia bacterium]
MLELKDVSVAYGQRRALEGVSLEVSRGEVVTLLGANGAGKSTTLRAISGLVRPRRGRILYDGRDVTGWPPDAIVAAGLCHVPEGRELFPDFSVLDNLLVGAHLASSREVPARLARAFALFPVLEERRRQPAATLSGGEQQMLAIARALMASPRLLLLDEPSLGLAPMVTREIFRVIQRINADGVTVLLVEQNARRALAVAGRGYVLETGRVVVSGPSRDLAADPRIRAAYLGGDAGPTRLSSPSGAATPEEERRRGPG